jgi:class 3 adenylate cyclase
MLLGMIVTGAATKATSRLEDLRAAVGSGEDVLRVTFLFTDIEGSTRLLKGLGSSYGEVLANHRTILRTAAREHRGEEVDTLRRTAVRFGPRTPSPYRDG